MLPFSAHDVPVDASKGGSVVMQLWSRLRRGHMDFEYALWLMANLCSSPRTAFRTTLYHSRTKHHWARDDPAFVVLILYLLLVATLAWCVAFAQHSPVDILSLYLYVVLVDFFLIAALLSTAGWWVANTYLTDSCDESAGWLSDASRRTETVEWLYAFDVHCNAFLPVCLLLHVGQYMMLPLLLRPGLLATLLSNTLYAAAFSIYHYLTFLGYSELPFLNRCECFIYPVALVLLAFVLLLPLKFNCTVTVAYVYFG
jgi:hypothetical protein